MKHRDEKLYRLDIASISSGKWLCQAKARAASSSCKVCKARTFHLSSQNDKVCDITSQISTFVVGIQE